MDALQHMGCVNFLVRGGAIEENSELVHFCKYKELLLRRWYLPQHNTCVTRYIIKTMHTTATKTIPTLFIQLLVDESGPNTIGTPFVSV